MDAYEAIDILNEYVMYTNEHGRAFAAPTPEEFEAIKIALEALKERARVI